MTRTQSDFSSPSVFSWVTQQNVSLLKKELNWQIKQVRLNTANNRVHETAKEAVTCCDEILVSDQTHQYVF